MSFLLTTEGWIPCRMPDGTSRDLGIVETLIRADEIEAVQDASPPVTLALHRFLLAILHRVFGPNDIATWTRMYRRGSFDRAPLEAYLRSFESRFDLLHSERPFFQVKGLTKLYEPNGLSRLVLERSNYGAEVNVFQHRPQEALAGDSLFLAQAARALLALQGFAPGGLVRKKDEPGSATAAPLNRGAFVIVHGKRLFETLMLNLVVYAPELERPTPGQREKDIPSWEQPEMPRPLGAKERERRPYGWIDWLTWQSRRVELVLDSARSRVVGIVYCVGQGLDQEGLHDPMLAYRIDKKRGMVAIDLSEDRAAWRDCHALVRKAGADGARPPAAVSQLASFELRSILGSHERLVLDVIGIRGDQAKIRLARHERLSLPAVLLESDELLASIWQATDAAEKVGWRLTTAIRDAVRVTLAPGGREPDPEDVRKVADSLGAERAYWGTLAIPFERFLDDLARRGSEAADSGFFAEVSAAARDCLRSATDALGTGAAKLRGAAVAENHLAFGLKDILQPPAAGVANTGGIP